MKATILGLALVLALTTAGQSGDTAVGTGTIHGRVVDNLTSKPLAYANVILVGTNMGAMSLADGQYTITGIPEGTYTVRAMMAGFKNADSTGVVVTAGETRELSFRLVAGIVAETQVIEVRAERAMVEVTESKVTASVDESQLQKMPVEDVLDAVGLKAGGVKTGDQMHVRGGRTNPVNIHIQIPQEPWRYVPSVSREQYEFIHENDFATVAASPVSTFGIDVDAASYANMRRFIRADQVPPPSAVRIEEFVNYFDYDYPQPDGEEPFSVVTETAECPWNAKHRLVHIGLQGREMDRKAAPRSNLVFLIDVSGSMGEPNKLSLVKDAMPMLVAQLHRRDRVAIVVYAGEARVLLGATPGHKRETLLKAIASLQAGGSTAGGAGIEMAYDIASRNFMSHGNNRVILVTDGDFNVGVSSDGELVRMIEKEREKGIFLTVVGVGTGNLQDAKLEKIADHGNGNYAYLDDLEEARKVFVNEIYGTIVTIAKDVKIQVEFNPLKVESYRLIGYENRLLEAREFRDDRKDAGDLGAGHSVTALYEVVPLPDSLGVRAVTNAMTSLQTGLRAIIADRMDLLTVRLRFKAPDGDVAREIARTAPDAATTFAEASENFRFSAAVAEYALVLRDSKYTGDADLRRVIQSARAALGDDPDGLRAEFVELAETCRSLRPTLSNND